MLITFVTDVNTANKEGKTALDLARISGNNEVIQLLIGNGAISGKP